MGAEGDRISTPDDVRATARHHGVEAAILPGIAHMLMLEPEWKDAAEALAAWLGEVSDEVRSGARSRRARRSERWRSLARL